MLYKALHDKVELTIRPVIMVLNDMGISPNQLTLAGLGLNILAGLIFANGWLFFGGLMLLVAGLGDLLDGPLSRASNRASAFGAFLDSTVDRYSDFFIFGGLALYFAKNGQVAWFLIVMGIILGSTLTSYTKARAESLIENCQVGLFERADRIVALALGSLFPFLLPLILWLLLVGTNATAIQRILHTYKALKNR